MGRDGKRSVVQWFSACLGSQWIGFGLDLPKDGLDQQEWAGNKPSTLGIGNSSVVE
jgi:hypothetical protein